MTLTPPSPGLANTKRPRGFGTVRREQADERSQPDNDRSARSHDEDPLDEFVRTFRIENEQDVETQLISGNYF